MTTRIIIFESDRSVSTLEVVLNSPLPALCVLPVMWGPLIGVMVVSFQSIRTTRRPCRVPHRIRGRAKAVPDSCVYRSQIQFSPWRVVIHASAVPSRPARYDLDRRRALIYTIHPHHPHPHPHPRTGEAKPHLTTNYHPHPPHQPDWRAMIDIVSRNVS